MQRWIKRYEEEGGEHPLASKHRTGRRRILSEIQENQLSEAVRAEPFSFVVKVKENLNVHCSNTTVRRVLHRKGLQSRVAAQKEELTADHKNARLRFATENLHRDWRGVVFTDEKTFRTSDFVKRKVWRQSGTRYAHENIQRVGRSGRICLSMWGCMNHDGPGFLVDTPTRMSAHDYLNILQNQFIPSYRARYPEGSIILVQDNSPVHTGRVVKDWLRNQPDIELID